MSPDPNGMMFALLARKDEANNLGLALTGFHERVFGSVSLGLPALEPRELGFIRCVSWLFVLNHEVGLIGTRFLAERIVIYAPAEATLEKHLELVANLRTYLQHNLDPASRRDATIRVQCEDWFAKQCGSKVPSGEEQWSSCLIGLIGEADLFLRSIVTVLRGIEADADRETILGDWNTRVTRHHPPHTFDALIPSVAAEMGRDKIDALALRKRSYDRWVAALRLLTGDYDFEREARKLIEHELLTATVPVLPITGGDIMTRFSLPSGEDIGILLRVARKLYDGAPCSASILLDRLEADPVGVEVLARSRVVG